MQTNWFFKQGVGYTPNSPDMQSLYRHLDYCQDNNVDVILTDWGIEPDWLKVSGLQKVDDSFRIAVDQDVSQVHRLPLRVPELKNELMRSRECLKTL